MKQGQQFVADVIRHGGASAAEGGGHRIPTGKWRDGLCDCFATGICHPMLWLACCCRPLAIGQVVTRIVAQRASSRAVLLYTMLVALTLSSLPLPFFWQAPTGEQWLLFGLSGICQAAGQFAMIAAYARATASRLAPYSYAQLLTATVLGFAIFGEVPDIFTVIGAALIVAGGLISLHLAGRPPKPGSVPSPKR